MINSHAIASVSPRGAPAPATASAELSTADDAAALYDQYGALAFSLAYRIVHDRSTAEEVVQEAFLSAWRNSHRYDATRGSLRTWLCQIVRNRALDRLRGSSARHREHRSLDEVGVLPAAADVLGDVLLREERQCVLAALASLTEGQRAVIELAYYGGYSQTEIATMTAVPLGTVKSRTRSAMRSLAAALAALRPASTALLATGGRG